MQPIPFRTRTSPTGQQAIDWDPCGAVFYPAPGANIPIYAYGANPKQQDPVFTCPVSAIPEAVWVLMDLWLASRAMGLPVRAGGLEAQPYVIRRSFPYFEAEMRRLEHQDVNASGMAAFAAMFSGGGSPVRPGRR